MYKSHYPLATDGFPFAALDTVHDRSVLSSLLQDQCGTRLSKIVYVALLMASHLPCWIQFMIALRSEPRRRFAVTASRDEIVVTMFCKDVPIGPRSSVLA